jgi:CCR4-NOT transcription complex subunit 4
MLLLLSSPLVLCSVTLWNAAPPSWSLRRREHDVLLHNICTFAWLTQLCDLGDTEFPPLGPPSRQQSISSIGRSTPPVPPGFEGHHHSGSESRRSTPTAPPGLTKPPTAVPDLDGGGSRPSSRASLKRQVSQVVPALPLRPGTPRAVSTPKLESRVLEETPTKGSKGGSKSNVAEEDPKSSVEADTAEKDDAEAKSSKVGEQRNESRPAVDTVKPPPKPEPTAMPAQLPGQKGAPKAMQPSAKGSATVQASSAKAAPVTPSKPDPPKNDAQKKKQPPGKLDIAAAVKDTGTTSSSKQVDSREQQDVPPPSATSKIESPSVASPAAKAAPKTLRVVATPKAENPPTSIPTPKEPVPPIPAVAAVTKLPSRKPSAASINPPGTPSSEQVSISDNLSMTSQSRANSPPPGAAPAVGSSKVGSAPVKAKTKNQLKKERQERAKAIEEEKAKNEEVVAKAVQEEPAAQAQEAIVSRKKKTKKEKEPKPPKVKSQTVPTAATPATGESTPTASRPVTPQQPKVEETVKPTKSSKPSTPINVSISRPPRPQSSGEPSPPPTPTINAAQLIAELKATTPEIQKCIDSLFRSPASTHYKPSQPITAQDIANFKQEFKIDLTSHEVHALLKGKVPAVRYGGENGRMWDRGMVAPSGAHLRALTQELELRFLELEKAINELPDEIKYRPTKPQNDVKFPSVDLEALKKQFENIGGRGVSVMEQMVQDGSTMKKGAFLVDEASKYINEFVMPPATPPPSAGGSVKSQQGGQDVGVTGMANVSPEIAERQLSEAKRVAEERDVQLKKAFKKNKKILGLG